MKKHPQVCVVKLAEVERQLADACPRCHAPANKPCRNYLGKRKPTCRFYPPPRPEPEPDYEQGDLF